MNTDRWMCRLCAVRKSNVCIHALKEQISFTAEIFKIFSKVTITLQGNAHKMTSYFGMPTNFIINKLCWPIQVNSTQWSNDFTLTFSYFNRICFAHDINKYIINFQFWNCILLNMCMHVTYSANLEVNLPITWNILCYYVQAIWHIAEFDFICPTI
jgi:hypothetical protein